MQELPKYPVATDIAVFSVEKNALKILLIKRKHEPFKGMHALPGGFLEPDDPSLDACASRELYEETGIKNIFIKMLHAYGDKGRDPRGRIISIAYLALVNSKELELNKPKTSEDAEWVDIREVGRLAFDHNKILEEATTELKHEIMNSNIVFQILPERFTLTEMQRVYETILGRKLDKRNFRKWAKRLPIRPTYETKMEGIHRPAMLYEFKTHTYARL
ncbi:NUDIX hydrolase [Candidatus Woesearchaeota archaeon]|nr:MAG: NUDIX hydrolase [Candidatus Woesearchaeota archaeon]